MRLSRRFRRVGTGAILAGLLAGLSACGAPSVEGTWVVDWSEIGAKKAPTKEGEILLKVLQFVFTPLKGGLWFRGDGRCFYRGEAFGEYHDRPAGRWEQDGDEVWITRDVDGDGNPVADAERVRTSLRLVDGRLEGHVPGMKDKVILKRAPNPGGA